jgi:ribosomal protein S18 acetylase RimI-like enzyme
MTPGSMKIRRVRRGQRHNTIERGEEISRNAPMPPSTTTRAFTADDYETVLRLWENAEGVEVAEGDDRASVVGYLSRNPNLSRVAVSGRELVGAVLCGHDGRRGLLYHLAVRTDFRGQGIGKQLVNECTAGLKACGIQRALILVDQDNEPGRQFWVARCFEEISGAALLGRDL